MITKSSHTLPSSPGKPPGLFFALLARIRHSGLGVPCPHRPAAPGRKARRRVLPLPDRARISNVTSNPVSSRVSRSVSSGFGGRVASNQTLRPVAGPNSPLFAPVLAPGVLVAGYGVHIAPQFLGLAIHFLRVVGGPDQARCPTMCSSGMQLVSPQSVTLLHLDRQARASVLSPIDRARSPSRSFT